MTRQDKISQTSWMTMPASIAVIIAGLYLAKGILVPCTLAVLLSFLLSPVCDWLERWKLGRIPAVLITATEILLMSTSHLSQSDQQVPS